MFFFLLFIVSVRNEFLQRLRIVDHDLESGNYIFRGNWPGIGDSFMFDNLTSTLKYYAAHHNLTKFPSDFYLVDISFLSPRDEKYKNEKKYFEKHPENGKLIHWHIKGTFMNASKMAKVERDLLLDTYKLWDLPDQLQTRLPELWKMFHTKYEKPRVFFGHCSAGVDRTGEFFGSYFMNWYDWTFPKALQWDIDVKSGDITHGCAHMMNWYCFYLEKESKGEKKLDCLNWSPWRF